MGDCSKGGETLNKETARKIGLNACIDKLGRDFVLAHRESATSAYGDREDGVFCFVGVDDAPSDANQNGVLVLDSQSVFPYRVSCTVGLTDGTPRFLECVLPT